MLKSRLLRCNGYTIAQVDDLLPQTQCGLCSYKGCKPYAEAIINQGEQINRCLPGGITTLMALGQLLKINPEPFVAEMAQKAKPPLRAVIREAECIGCAKCIQACPVDAILGAAKQMHTVIADQCTGCELCVAPCPVDCIEMQTIPALDVAVGKQKTQQFRQRFYAREVRLTRDKIQQQTQHQHAKLAHETDPNQVLANRQSAVASAVARAKAKKQESNEQ
ncbi:MAG: RnfABCDGE type electron transport complex subunit B [Gammaproteobacteria bacterium]